MSEGDTAAAGDPVRAVPAVPVPATGQPAADRLGAQSGHCRCWWIRFVAFRRGRFQRLAPGLLMSSAPRVSTAGAGGPARGTPAGPVPAAGAQAADELSAQAADELSAQGGHCWSWRSGSRCSGGAGACGWRSATSGGIRHQELCSPGSEVSILVFLRIQLGLVLFMVITGARCAGVYGGLWGTELLWGEPIKSRSRGPA